MNRYQKNVSAAIAAVLGSTGLMNVASAGNLQFTFTDNLNSAWGAGLEFAITTQYGTVNDGPKDIFFGGETWTFQGSSASNLVGGALTQTSRPGSNSGASGPSAPITDGQAGFPICTTPNSCYTLQQTFFIGGAAFTFLAPVVGSSAAAAFGGTMEILAWDESGAAGSVQIWMPVANAQWAGTVSVIGADPTRVTPTVLDGDKITFGTAPTGPGVTFTGSASGGVFNLTAALTMTRDEVAVPPLANNLVNWDVTGTYAISPQVPIPAAAWLLGSGLLGLVGAARRKRAA